MSLALPGFTRRRFQEVVRFISMVPGYGPGFAWLLRCFIMVLRRVRFAVRMGRGCERAACVFRRKRIGLNNVFGIGVGFACLYTAPTSLHHQLSKHLTWLWGWLCFAFGMRSSGSAP